MHHDDCVADFNFCFNTRRTYHGACLLEYQNIKKLIIEALLQWDTKKQGSKGKDVVGTILAFAKGNEKQNQGTFHGHCQAYVEELNNELRNGLF